MLFILDRDGVINADPVGYINDPDNWHALDGSLEAIATLHQAGHKVAVCSNQSGIGRGLITPEQLEMVHQKMAQQLRDLGGEFCGIYFCPHHPDDGCVCRKPSPYLYHKIIDNHVTDDNIVWAIGDSVRDVAAGVEANCHTALVLTGNGEKQQHHLPEEFDTKVFADLRAVVKHIMEQTNDQ